MRVCITGANCFIGFPLVKKASELGWDVIAVIRRGNKCKLQLEQIKNVTVIELNLEEYVHLGKMTGYVDCLVMLAWGGVRGELRNDAVLQRSNYEYCLAGINSIIEYGCKRVLTAGSQAEYGIVNGIINEETPCNPVNEYGKYKLELYKSVSNICRKKEITHIEPRIFSIYGPGDYEGSLIMSIINKMRNNEVCELTQCTQVWDYLYIDDAVEALSILCQEGASGVYNLGNGRCRKLFEFVKEMKVVLRSESVLKFGAIPYGVNGMIGIEPCVDKIQKEIKWKAKKTFRDGIKAIIDFQVK